MFRKSVLFIILGAISVSFIGCDNTTSVNHNSVDETTARVENVEDDFTIFDNIIAGTVINDI